MVKLRYCPKKYIVGTFVFTVFMSILGFKKIHIKNHFHFSREKKSLKFFLKRLVGNLKMVVTIHVYLV